MSEPTPGQLPWFLALGVLTGLLGVLFNRTLIASLHGCRWLARHVSPWLVPAAVALMVGVLAWYQPGWVGGGGSLLLDALGGEVAVGIVGVLLAHPLRADDRQLLGRLGRRHLRAAAGVGALVGLLFASALTPLTGPLDAKATTAIVLCAMAGLFTAVVRAPLTGVLLMVEMARAYELLLPLLAVSLLAKWTADALGDTPVYEALREL